MDRTWYGGDDDHLRISCNREQAYTMIQKGRYRHYKGNEYEVLGCATHTETEEEFVVSLPLI